jgi:hypothetical protein
MSNDRFELASAPQRSHCRKLSFGVANEAKHVLEYEKDEFARIDHDV